ncbi:GNAT family N-acetyltransferase [Aeromicrobium ginsengisoli]|uniref:GNAT family N-acetyltransferase n=1 Tax=Aeromicrobium ginsengisoli TaxID=363867 RepID=A0A5M4FJT3_9ACTN|nr:GNAT family N-acetyltransferase [Aeromicrobium ginsengisoli]KAA1399865.1 GNAT family N-acetyltransferase [Aeromicrobium ginsengisoli]
MNLVLRRLALSDEADTVAAVAEMAAEGGHWSYRYRPDLPWPAYVDLVHGWEVGRDLPGDFVANADLVADVDGVVVGRSSLRFELNEFLRTLGGHIGYAVRPQFRGRGRATEILRQSVDLLRARGISPALVTCDDDNVASAKVIEANGVVLEAVVPGVADMPKRRYWVS